ncbi:MAG TPA: tetratricopeptide repeat protein [Myxococcota bacterium]|jgi:tetratricopeptide (TPR) repeat protein
MSRSTAWLSVPLELRTAVAGVPRWIWTYLAVGGTLLACGGATLGCGGDVEARMAEVRALQDVGQFTASIDELREILAIRPDDAEASYRLGVALVQTGEASRAVWPLQKAAESPDYAVAASLLLASAHFANGNFEAVVAAADRVLEIDPDRVVALRMRAKGNLGAGKLDAAMADTERLLEKEPDDYSVNLLRATILADSGKLDEAEAANYQLKEIGEKSGDPSTAPRACLVPAAFAKDTRKDIKKAEELFEECLGKYPANAFVTSEAMSFYDAIGKPERATQLVRAAAEQAPENLSLQAGLASRLETTGDSEGAEKVLLAAVESFKSAGAWDLLTSYYRRAGESQKALDSLEKVIELSGEPSDGLRFVHADLLIDLEQLDQAEAVAKELEEPTYANLIRGRIQLERGDAKAALESFEQGIRNWPNNAGARYLAGLAARQLGDFDRAISELREAVRIDNGATEAARVLARLHFDRGEWADAIKSAHAALRRPGGKTADTLIVGVRSFMAIGQWSDARTTAKALIQLPDGRAAGTAELAGVERAAVGPAEAVAVIRKSKLDLTDPANEVVLRALVENSFAADKSADALAAIDAALAKHPELASLHELRGYALGRLERTDEAKAELNKALELDPKNAAATGALATLRAREGDRAGAIELYDAAAKLAEPPAPYSYLAAQLVLAAGDTAGAESRLREVVRLDPGNVGARNDLAWLLAEKGTDLDAALALAEAAKRLDPSADVLDTLGWVLLKRGEAQAAVESFEQALAKRPDSPSIRYRLGIALNQAGDKTRAREMFQAALAAGAFPEAEAARRDLAQLEGK